MYTTPCISFTFIGTLLGHGVASNMFESHQTNLFQYQKLILYLQLIRICTCIQQNNFSAPIGSVTRFNILKNYCNYHPQRPLVQIHSFTGMVKSQNVRQRYQRTGSDFLIIPFYVCNILRISRNPLVPLKIIALREDTFQSI